MTKASNSACLAAVFWIAAVGATAASSFRIDPDPASPTLGDLVEREKSLASGLRGSVPDRPRPVVTSVPRAPREAVTVIVPGRRLR